MILLYSEIDVCAWQISEDVYLDFDVVSLHRMVCVFVGWVPPCLLYVDGWGMGVSGKILWQCVGMGWCVIESGGKVVCIMRYIYIYIYYEDHVESYM